MRYRLLALIVLVSTVWGSCSEPCQWDQYLGDPGRTGYTFCDGPDSPEILWEIDLDGEIGTPFTAEGKVFVLCRRCIEGCSFGSIPTIETKVIAVDLLTGALLQETVYEGELTGVYPLGEDMVLAESGGEFFEINLSSEEMSLVFQIPRESFCFPYCYPLILPDKVIVPSTPVMCFSRDGYTTLWDLQSSLESRYPENGKAKTIAASIDQLFVILEEETTNLWAINPEDGKLIWVSDALTISRIATDGSAVFVGGENLYALRPDTGELLWIFDVDFIRSNIVVGSHAVYFTDNKKLYAVDKNSGELKWESQWKGVPFWITYLVGAGNTLICSDILNLTAFSTEGEKLWNMHFQDYVDSSPEKPCPAVEDGILVVEGGELSSKLMALASGPDLFAEQGDAYLSEGLTDKALKSYKKAKELYEKEGNLIQLQEMEEQIGELENLPETIPLESPQELPLVPVSILIVTVLTGISVVYYFIRVRKS